MGGTIAMLVAASAPTELRSRILAIATINSPILAPPVHLSPTLLSSFSALRMLWRSAFAIPLISLTTGWRDVHVPRSLCDPGRITQAPHLLLDSIDIANVTCDHQASLWCNQFTLETVDILAEIASLPEITQQELSRIESDHSLSESTAGLEHQPLHTRFAIFIREQVSVIAAMMVCVAMHRGASPGPSRIATLIGAIVCVAAIRALCPAAVLPLPESGGDLVAYACALGVSVCWLPLLDLLLSPLVAAARRVRQRVWVPRVVRWLLALVFPTALLPSCTAAAFTDAVPGAGAILVVTNTKEFHALRGGVSARSHGCSG
eukprot:c18974_g1_i2.p1 GENE.c18974_g1_i2~~c18974_g1_i2.p1  ORF type:complete len:319 (+),score=60.89 c18974_g1_i2:537-1493(+)